MCDLQRVGAKIPLADGRSIALERLVPVFHRWIRSAADGAAPVPGLLIDVADYAHVPDGPGMMLIAHEADYALDLGLGGPGLLYQQKRGATGTTAERIASSLASAVRAARRLETEPDLGGPRFEAGAPLVRVVDRLRAPAEDATLERLRPDLVAAAVAIYGEAPSAIERVGDPTLPFTVRMRVPAPGGLEAVEARLGAPISWAAR